MTMKEKCKQPGEFLFPPTVLVGAGHLGKALLKGISDTFSPTEFQHRLNPLPLITVDRHLKSASICKGLLKSIENLPDKGFTPQVIILAVRPSQVKEAIFSLAEKYKDICSSGSLPHGLTLVSCVVGVSIDQLTNLWKQHSSYVPNIVRVMPTILSSQREGISFFYHVDEVKDVYPIKVVKELFSFLSRVIEVGSELEMDMGIVLVSSLMGVLCNIASSYEKFLLNIDCSEKDAKELIADILIGMGKFSINQKTWESISPQIETPGGITASMMEVFHSKLNSTDLLLDMLRIGMDKIEEIKGQINERDE